MPENIGYSFAPGADANGQGQQPTAGGNGRPRAAGQEAVRILNLHVPKALPSNAPVNRSLLTGPGSAAAGSDSLTSMVRALMDAFKPQAPMGAPAMPRTVSNPNPVTTTPMPSMPTFPMGGMDPEPPRNPSRPSPSVPTQPPSLHAPPVFEGFVDTPPMQNAPLFDDWMTNESPYENAYAAIGADDDEQRRKYLDQVWQAYNQALQSQTAPRPANPPGPSWNWNAGNTPTNGGTNA